jgi:hypothetical protein
MPEEETPELEPVVQIEKIMGRRISIALLRDDPIIFDDPAMELELEHTESWVIVKNNISENRSGLPKIIAMINTTEVRMARIDAVEYEVPITAESEPEPDSEDVPEEFNIDPSLGGVLDEAEADEEPPGEPGTQRPDIEKDPAKKGSD